MNDISILKDLESEIPVDASEAGQQVVKLAVIRLGKFKRMIGLSIGI